MLCPYFPSYQTFLFLTEHSSSLNFRVSHGIYVASLSRCTWLRSLLHSKHKFQFSSLVAGESDELEHPALVRATQSVIILSLCCVPLKSSRPNKFGSRGTALLCPYLYPPLKKRGLYASQIVNHPGDRTLYM